MHIKTYRALFFILCSLLLTQNALSLEAKYTNKNGLFILSGESGALLSSSYIGWGKGWKWDAPSVGGASANSGIYKFRLNFNKQKVKSFVEVKSNNRSIKYTYNHKFNRTLEDTIGGGIEFNLDLISQIKNFEAKEPKLLAGNKGWSWEFKPGKTIEVKFPLGNTTVYFERGNKARIRAMFFSGEAQRGSSKLTYMEINLPADSKVIPFTNVDEAKEKASWLKNSLNTVESFIDLSELNEKPAGKHGFVKSVKNQFKFSDGTPIRFFGTNVQAYSLFVNNKNLIKQHAKRIAKLGFNLVRLHHHDSPWVNPSLINKGETTQKINKKALDNYFWWIKCLRDEGIYIWVDLQVQRPWRAGDKISGWKTDMERKAKNGMAVSKGFVYLNRRMQELTKKFNEELLTSINPYTKLALKDDPAVMGMLITNENDLSHHFGNRLLKNKGHPYHRGLFDKEVSLFADKFDLSEEKVRQTWIPGASKYLLNDIEARFNKDMIKHLRGLGVKVPLATTNLWGDNALFSLPALSTGDIIDAHAYTADSVFKKSPLQKSPYTEANFLHWLGQGQVVDKPFTVTEYNVGFRSDEDNAYVPVVAVASMSTFQGWDAIMLYGYSQDTLKGWSASPWSSYTHPAIMGVIPAMALLYRQGHVAPAKKTVVLSPVNDDIFTKSLSPNTSITIRTTLEQHRMVVALPKTKILPWLTPSNIPKNARVIHDLNKSLLPANQNYIESDTGEIKRNWKTGIMTVNTPKSQLAMGRIGEKNIKLGDVVIKSKTPEAAIIFTSLDNKPIKSSEKILLSAVAKVAKVKVKWMSSYISEPVNASLTLSSIYNDLHLIPLRSDGREGESRPIIKVTGGKYTFSLSEKDKTHWYLIKRIPK